MYELLAKVQINKAETVSSSKRANGRCHAPPYGGGLRLNWSPTEQEWALKTREQRKFHPLLLKKNNKKKNYYKITTLVFRPYPWKQEMSRATAGTANVKLPGHSTNRRTILRLRKPKQLVFLPGFLAFLTTVKSGKTEIKCLLEREPIGSYCFFSMNGADNLLSKTVASLLFLSQSNPASIENHAVVFLCRCIVVMRI